MVKRIHCHWFSSIFLSRWSTFKIFPVIRLYSSIFVQVCHKLLATLFLGKLLHATSCWGWKKHYKSSRSYQSRIRRKEPDECLSDIYAFADIRSKTGIMPQRQLWSSINDKETYLGMSKHPEMQLAAKRVSIKKTRFTSLYVRKILGHQKCKVLHANGSVWVHNLRWVSLTG